MTHVSFNFCVYRLVTAAVVMACEGAPIPKSAVRYDVTIYSLLHVYVITAVVAAVFAPRTGTDPTQVPGTSWFSLYPISEK